LLIAAVILVERQEETMRKFNAIKNAANFAKSTEQRKQEARDLIEYLDRQKNKREKSKKQLRE